MVNTRSTPVPEEDVDQVEEMAQVGLAMENLEVEDVLDASVKEKEDSAPAVKPELDIYQLHKMVKKTYEALSFATKDSKTCAKGRRCGVGGPM